MKKLHKLIGTEPELAELLTKQVAYSCFVLSTFLLLSCYKFF